MNKKLIFSLVSLIAVTFLVIFLLVPFWNSVKSLKSGIENKNSKIEMLNRLLSKTEQLEQEYQQVKGEAEKVFLALPKEKDIPNLIVQFGDLAAMNGLVFESIQFGELEKKKEGGTTQEMTGIGEEDIEEGITEEAEQLIQQEQPKAVFRSLPVTVNVSGFYDSFKKYVSDLEHNIRSMNVTKIDFSGSGGDSGEGGGESPEQSSFEFNLELSVYYQ